MAYIWERPYECDEWTITTSYMGKTFFTRRDRYEATAKGYRQGELWASYTGLVQGAHSGRTREEAERRLRGRICEDIERYREWLEKRGFQRKKFTMTEVCP